MGLSVLVLGILIGAFIVPVVLTDPEATVETGEVVVSSITKIVEMFT